MANSYGFEANVAATVDEKGKYSVGVHFKDSDGLDMSNETNADSLAAAINDICSKMHKQLTEKREKRVDEKKKQRDELQKKIDELQAQVDAIDGVIRTSTPEPKVDKESGRKSVRKTFDDLYGDLITDFFTW